MPFSSSSSGSGVLTSQAFTGTSSISNWGSIITITSATASNITLPLVTTAGIGKSIIITNNGIGIATTLAFSGDTLQNSRVLAQGEAITVIATAVNLARVVSDTVATPVITESLPAWAATTAVNQSAQRSATIGGVLTGLSSNSTRTTGATFNASEGGNWIYLAQSSVPAFPASNLVLTGFQIVDSGQTYQSNSTRTTGTIFDTIEQSNWAALSSSSTGTRISLSNFATNTSIGLASATVDSATVIAFAQTTTGITVTIPSPTNVNVHKTLSFENLTTATQPITIRGAAGGTDTIILGIGDVKEMSWNGNGWRATSPANVLAEYGENTSIADAQTTTSTTYTDVAGSAFTLPSAGIWEIDYNIFLKNGTATTVTRVIVTDSLDNPVANSQASYEQVSGVDVQAPTGNKCFITTTGSASYKLRWQVSSSTGFIYNNSTISGVLESGNSKITWKKIGGFSPVTGTTVDTASVNLTGSNFSIPVVNTDVIFNTLAFGNIPYNTSTGVFTLTSGKTYELEATLKSRATTAGYVQYEWVDGVTGVAITGGINGLDMQAPSLLVEGSSARAYLMYTPNTNQTVKVRVTGISGVAIQLDSARCNANIKQIGNSMTTTTTRVNVICRNKTVNSLGNATWTKLTGWTVISDATGSLNSATGLFTAPRTANYLFSAGDGIPTTATGQYAGISIYRNAATQLYNNLILSGGTSTNYIQTSGIIELASGETIEVRAYNGASTANDVNSVSNSWFTITEINPTF